MSSRMITLLLFALALGVAFEYLFHDQLLGVNYPVWIGAFMVGALAFFSDRISVAGQRIWFFFGGSFLFAVMVFVRESELLTTLNLLASLGLLALGIESLAGRQVRSYAVFEYASTIFLPVKCFPHFFFGLQELTAFEGAEKYQALRRALKGSLIAFPIVGVLILLFSSADLVFRKYVTELISLDILITMADSFLRVGLVAGAAFAVYAYIAHHSGAKLVSPPSMAGKMREPSFGPIEMSIVLGSVSLVFFAFLLIQFAYFFGGEGAITNQGFAYAEYARQGFFELIAVSLIAFFLLLAAARQVVRDGTRHLPVFKWLAGILILETVFVMASSFQRLSLYELAYGFTTLRLYSHIFIVWIGTILLLLGYEIFVREDRAAFAFRGIISMACFLLAVNILNPDQFIARQNIERYAEMSEIDLGYLSTLSTDAFPETIRLLDDAAIAKRASLASSEAQWHDEFRFGYQRMLDTYLWRSQPHPGSPSADWPSMHLSRWQWQAIYAERETEIREALARLWNGE